jgi:phenylpropionate dioxygenase-like ring-hydroxylating dioxygenase large terminal subunit
MYPFKYESSIVRNRWYMAAFSSEISREPMERTLLNKPVVMYRKEDGRPVAMYGLCPHRYFPLAKGRLVGDAIACGYHGFTFADTGECIKIPSQDDVPSNICQPVYPMEERGPICWIWMGDIDKCDKNLIPPYEEFGLDQPDWHYSSENYFLLEGRSQLLIDNLMDLTHLPYVHHHVPGGESMAKTAMTIEDRDASCRIVRSGKVPWTPFFDSIYGKEVAYEGLADFDALSDFYGPELIRTSLPTITSIESSDEVPKGFGAFWILHGITPETETTTHYFGFATRNFRQGDEALDSFWLESDTAIRQQDVNAIKAVEERLDVAVQVQKELLVVADRPASKARRIIKAMLEEENTAADA